MRSELTLVVYVQRSDRAALVCIVNAGNKRSGLRTLRSDTNSARITNHSFVADIDVVPANRKILSSRIANGDVIGASCVVERD